MLSACHLGVQLARELLGGHHVQPALAALALEFWLVLQIKGVLGQFDVVGVLDEVQSFRRLGQKLRVHRYAC